MAVVDGLPGSTSLLGARATSLTHFQFPHGKDHGKALALSLSPSLSVSISQSRSLALLLFLLQKRLCGAAVRARVMMERERGRERSLPSLAFVGISTLCSYHFTSLFSFFFWDSGRKGPRTTHFAETSSTPRPSPSHTPTRTRGINQGIMRTRSRKAAREAERRRGADGRLHFSLALRLPRHAPPPLTGDGPPTGQ